MPLNGSQEIQRTTKNGTVHFQSYCPPDKIKQYNFSPFFGTHAQYKSLYTKRESLVQDAALSGTNVTMAIDADGMIIGFGVLSYPEGDERWAELKPDVMMEVKVIEVGRNWRSSGIAKGILEMLLADSSVEEKIVYMVGYSWTWDLEGTRHTAQLYRKMLIRLFEPFGFIEYETNEPNICLKPENLFMGRVGERVAPEAVKAFKWLRFGMTP